MEDLGMRFYDEVADRMVSNVETGEWPCPEEVEKQNQELRKVVGMFFAGYPELAEELEEETTSFIVGLQERGREYVYDGKGEPETISKVFSAVRQVGVKIMKTRARVNELRLKEAEGEVLEEMIEHGIE